MKKTITQLLELLPASFQSTYSYERRGINFYYELTIKGSSDAGMNDRSGSDANVYEIFYQPEEAPYFYGHKPKIIRIDVCHKNRDLREALENFYNFVKKNHPEVFKNY